MRNSKENVDMTDLNIGDIFVNIWGWEQTNANFYQIIGKTNKSVTIQEVNIAKVSGGDMRGTVIPKKDDFKNENKIRKIVKNIGCNNPIYILKMEYGFCYLWDKKPVSVTSYA